MGLFSDQSRGRHPDVSLDRQALRVDLPAHEAAGI